MGGAARGRSGTGAPSGDPPNSRLLAPPPPSPPPFRVCGAGAPASYWVMRPLSLLLNALVVAPAAAQRAAIAPSPSVLFAASPAEAIVGSRATADTGLSRDPREVGAGIGVILGFA